MQLPILDIAVSEVRVHNGSPALLLQAVLMTILNGPQECWRVSPFGGAEPVANEGAERVHIRHQRAGFECVDVRENEIAAVSDSLAAGIAPECGMSLHMPEESPLIPA